MTVCEINNIKERCYGCEACSCVCPSNAIRMIQDPDGFFCPEINKTCVNCGKCVTVCQIANSIPAGNFERALFWCYSKDDEIRAASSSGGLFTALAKRFLSAGGIVFGAALDNDLHVCHTSAVNHDDLHKLVRSKYVQSRINTVFSEVKSALETGADVLFCGTPCQIAGLSLFLMKDYPNLLMADFICHGVPSPRLYSDMLLYFENKYQNKISSITFREKENGWRKLTTKIYFIDGKKVCIPSENTFYYDSFIKNYSLRKSCFACPYVQNHVSDITLADYWGTSIKDDKGVSFVTLNTLKGEKAFNDIKNTLVHGALSEKDVSACFMKREENADYDLTKRDTFFRIYNQNGFAYAQKKYMYGVVMKHRLKNTASWGRKKLSKIKQFMQKGIYLHE